VRLYATARVDGDITHAQIAIDAGAHFAGRSVKLVPAVPEQLSLVPEAAE
jgi:cytoskeletal protein CcmA (bactofilin family)